ncbi:hypothetical protein M406DRAFT_250089, partial [Cryphonectria parasitica EP155]
IFSINYKLALSYKIRIYSVFHILLLKLAVQKILADNIAEVENNESEYKIEKILKYRSINSMREYLIK